MASTIKSDHVDLKALLNVIAPETPQVPVQNPAQPNVQPNVQQAATAAAVDNTNNFNPVEEKLFEFDYDALKKTTTKKVRKTINKMVAQVLPKDVYDNDYVKDKIEQDVDILTDLYMQLETNNIMQRSLIDAVSRGNSMPKMYEMFGQLSDKIQNINKQIVDTEQKIRHTYQDIKIDVREKQADDLTSKAGGGTILLSESNANDPAMIEAPQDNIVVTSSKQLIEQARKRHLEKMKQRELEKSASIDIQ